MASTTSNSRNRAPLSVAALQIVRASLQEDTSVAELSRFAEADPAFAIRILALVNSAAFARSRRVQDVKQAAALAGVRGLRNIGLSLALTDMIPRGEIADTLLACCVRRATAAKLLAEATGKRPSDDYFAVGLFMDVGLLTRARHDPAGAIETARLPARNRLIFERSLGVLEHTEGGAQLAEEFHLPAPLSEAIRRHHEPEPPSANDLARVAWVAERFAALFEGGDADRLRAEAHEAARHLGLSTAQADAIAAEIPPLAASTAQGLGCVEVTEQVISATIDDANRGLAELNQSYEIMVRRLEAIIHEKAQLATRLEEANRRLENMAMTDALTGLANRRAMETVLQRDLSRAERDQTELSILTVDVDHFKRVNDTYGHAVGDVVLVHIANALREGLRAGDISARAGGEEFVVILPSTPLSGALIAAERLRARIEAARIVVEGTTIAITASIGAASIRGPGCAARADDLLRRSDDALYQAKRAGRNRVVHST